MKEFLEDKIDDIVWIWKKIQNFYYDIKYGIKNLIIWFPIIWKDRSWDYSYMFPIWEKKFDLMIESFKRGSKYVCGCEKHIKRLKICKEICRRQKDDWWYHENGFMFHDKKWGTLDCSVENGFFKTHRENVKTPEDEKIETQQFLNIHKLVEQHKKEDMNMLLNYINKYWQSWWW
jgi:hypothetical protein